MWGYGPEGAAYPVRRGEMWRAGSHLFICESAFEVESPPDEAFLVYCDPPWNQALMTGFYTKAGLPKSSLTWLDLYRRIIVLAAGGPCFIEGGEKWADEVAGVCRFAGEVYARWPITYYRKHPGVLHYVGPPLPGGFDPSGLDDDDTPGAVLAAFAEDRTQLVVDPCAGRGVTSRAAAEAGWASVNIELHPARVSAALDRLAKKTGLEPRKVTAKMGLTT